eukprot:4277298-Amphidinium_carterae.1
MYIRWCQACEVPAFPLNETTCYRYICHLRDERAAPTRASRFKESLGFFQGTIGLDASHVLDSNRIHGAVFTQMEQKRPLRQRLPLTVSEVRYLETMVTLSPVNSQNAVFAGYCLLCVHGCIRYNDGQRLQAEPTVDDLFFEAHTAHRKTSHLRGAARRLLPIAGYVAGVTGLPWAEAWIMAREHKV